MRNGLSLSPLLLWTPSIPFCRIISAPNCHYQGLPRSWPSRSVTFGCSMDIQVEKSCCRYNISTDTVRGENRNLLLQLVSSLMFTMKPWNSGDYPRRQISTMNIAPRPVKQLSTNIKRSLLHFIARLKWKMCKAVITYLDLSLFRIKP